MPITRRPLVTSIQRYVSLAIALALSLSVWGMPPLRQAAGDVRDSDRVLGIALDDPGTPSAEAPDVEMTAGILVDGSGRALWARDPDRPLPMASTTKMMSALVVRASAGLVESVTVSPSAAAVGGSGVDLRAGETLRVQDLLLALLMESSNSAAHALAEHVSGSVEAFVARMNSRARTLGLDRTSFTNPHGLHEDGHAASAHDLAVLADEVLEDPVLREAVAFRTATIPGPGGTRTLESSNRLLFDLPGADGVKTGWTDPAGYCLVASARRGDVRLVAVVLGADSEEARFEQAETLLEWGFARHREYVLVPDDVTVGPVVVTDHVDVEVDLRPARTASRVLFELDGPVEREWEMPLTVRAPVDYGEPLGTLTVYQGSEPLTTVPLVSTAAVAEPSRWERVTIWLERLWRALTDGGSVEAT